MNKLSQIFAPLYEFGDLYVSPYSNILYDGSGYFLLGLTFILSAIILLVLFYYGWDPVYGKWYQWFLTIIGSAILAFAIAYGITSEKLVDYLGNPDFEDSESFVIQTAALTSLYTFILAIILSFVIRIKSSHNKANPIPLKFL